MKFMHAGAEVLAPFCLHFAHVWVVAPFILLGYVWISRKVFHTTIILFFMSMLVNHLLKYTFKVPLLPSVGEGFACPSGHMQFAVVLYGWLALQLSHRKPGWRDIGLVTAGSIIIAEGWALVYCGYHHWIDVLAAIPVGVSLIAGYQWILRKHTRNAPFLVSGIATGLLLGCYWIYAPMASHLWMAYYSIMGLTVSESVFGPKILAFTWMDAILKTVIGGILLWGMYTIFSLPMFAHWPQWLKKAPWGLAGLLLPALQWGIPHIRRAITEKF